MNHAESQIEYEFKHFAQSLGLTFLPSVSIVSRDDPSTLFITAGIQLLRRQILGGELHGPGCANAQWCLRMNALEDVGVTQKLTSFRLLTSLVWTHRERIAHMESLFEFFDRILRVKIDDLRFTVSLGTDGQYDDESSLEALERLGVHESSIVTRPRRWAAPFGTLGPTGPNLFIAVIRTPGDSPIHFWNMEFLNYYRDQGALIAAKQPILDCAGNLETALAVADGSFDVYKQGTLGALGGLVAGMSAAPLTESSTRILSDHLRSAALLLGAGVDPGARGHGSVLRRLMRRSFVLLMMANGTPASYEQMLHNTFSLIGLQTTSHISVVIAAELMAFDRLICCGQLAFNRLLESGCISASGRVPAAALHRLHSESGVPLEILCLWLSRASLETDHDDYRRRQILHSERSRSAQGPYVKRIL
jgi:alanyl-tRNA synthetase